MKRTSAGAVFLTVVVDLVGFGIVLPLLPLYADRFHATGEEIGLLFSSFSAMQFLFAPVWGRISDRVGRRPVLLVGLAGSVVFYTVFGLADSVAWLFVSRIGAGICGATISVSNAYIADVTPPEQRARGMALIGAAFGIGFTIGPPLGFLAMHEGEALAAAGFAPPWLALGMPGFAAAAISLVSFLWTLTSVGEPPRHQATGRRHFDLGAVGKARSKRTLALLLAFHFVSVFAFSGFEGTLSLMLRERYGFAQKPMGMIYLYIGVLLTLFQGILVRKVLDRGSRSGLLAFGCVLAAEGIAGTATLPGTPALFLHLAVAALGLVCLLLTLFPGFPGRRILDLPSERSLVNVGLVLMALGLAGLAICTTTPGLLLHLAVAVQGFACVTPSLSSLISRQAVEGNQGAMMGLAASASALGRIFGPFVGNLVYAPRGQQGTALGPALEPLFGTLAHHQRPYVMSAVLVALLAVTASVSLPREDGGDPPGG